MRWALLTALAVSCGGGRAEPPNTATRTSGTADRWAPPAAPTEDVPAILARYAEFTARVCRCTDNDCLEQVTDERNRFGYEMKRKYGEPDWTREQEAQGMQLRDEYVKCVLRIGKRDPNRPSSSEQRVLTPMAELRDQMCACADRRCIDRVRAALAEYYEATAHIPLDDDQVARLKVISDELLKCGVRPLPP